MDNDYILYLENQLKKERKEKEQYQHSYNRLSKDNIELREKLRLAEETFHSTLSMFIVTIYTIQCIISYAISESFWEVVMNFFLMFLAYPSIFMYSGVVNFIILGDGKYYEYPTKQLILAIVVSILLPPLFLILSKSH